MKGLALALLAALLTSISAIGGPIEIGFGAGPAATSLEEINASITVFNAVIEHLNETFAAHPNVSGVVGPIAPMGSGLSVSASERYWITDWLALGAQVEYVRSSTSVLGQYQGTESGVSTLDIALGMSAVGFTVGGRVTFLDMGLRLAGEASAGYYYATFNRSVVFEIPSEYPDALAGVPPEGAGRYTGGTFGFEVGLSLSYPVTSWFTMGSFLSYRSAGIPVLTDLQQVKLDLDGDGNADAVNLDGIVVQLTFSLAIDLSPDGRKE